MAQFFDVPDAWFPIHVRYVELGGRDDEPVYELTIDQPGVCRIPRFGRPMRVIVSYGDGRVERYQSDPG